MASIENLLTYIQGNKLGHDNTQKQNNFLSYFKNKWYGHEYREKESNDKNNNVQVEQVREVDLYSDEEE